MNILLFGADTRIGYEFDRLLKLCNAPHTSTKTTLEEGYMQATDSNTIKALIECMKPTIVINCISINEGERNPRVNYEIPCSMSDLCNAKDITLVHFSIDAVYEGNRGYYAETSHLIAKPNGFLSDKIESDRYIMKNCKKHLILRGNFYGHVAGDAGSLAKNIRHLLAGQSINANANKIFTPIFTGSVVDIALTAIQKNLTGLYNVGTDVLNMYEFMCSIRKKLNRGSVKKIVEARRNTTLDTSKIKDAGILMPKVKDDLTAFIRRFMTIEKENG